MSSVVESVYFSSAIMGIAVHELACAGYYLMAKVVNDKQQLQRPIFLISAFSFFMALMQVASQTAILHYKARGSTDPFEVQNAWFTNTIVALNTG
jgi:hypothetical protein